MYTLKDEVFKKYITGGVDFMLGPASLASTTSQLQIVNNLMLNDLYELWALARSNGLAQVLFHFCMAYAGNIVKHPGWNSEGATIPGTKEGRVKAVRKAKALLTGARGARTKGDLEAREKAVPELEYYQGEFETILTDLEADCALALTRFAQHKKSEREAGKDKSAGATATAAAAAAAAAASLGQVTKPKAGEVLLTANQFHQLESRINNVQAAVKEQSKKNHDKGGRPSRWDDNPTRGDDRRDDKRGDPRGGRRY